MLRQTIFLFIVIVFTSTVYAGSNNINDVAWYNSNSDNKTHPVGTKMENELGL